MIQVVCAIIEHQHKVLVTQRSVRMDQAGLWEFPGGKCEAGESEAEALVREIQEELHIRIRPEQLLGRFPHQDLDKSLCLIAYTCSWRSGELKLEEHAASRWLHKNELSSLNWCPADLPVVAAYLKQKA